MTSTSLATLRWLAISLAACALALAGSPPAQAATGLTELPATGADGPVTVFYPTSSPEQAVQRLGFTLQVAPDGAAARGNGRLIVLSHGTGSPPWVLSDLARHLVGAGFIVAMPEHAGDHLGDQSKIGPPSWKLRPLEVSRTIDAMGADARFGPLFDINKVGLWGFSAGGHTALTMAGGRWSPARIRDHCDAHIADDFAACTGGLVALNGGLFDGLKKSVALTVIHWKNDDATMYGHTDPRIKAIVSAAPWAANFDLASLTSPPVPLGLIQAGRDVWLVPRFHVGAVMAACKTCELIASMPNAAHGAMLSPFPPELPASLTRLVGDPADFNRAADIPLLNQRTTAFFQKHLLAEVARP
jgi:predicted dienelactone hydrolase